MECLVLMLLNLQFQEQIQRLPREYFKFTLNVSKVFFAQRFIIGTKYYIIKINLNIVHIIIKASLTYLGFT